MVDKPDCCCADGCGKPTTSHNVAVDVSRFDSIGLPTLAGVVCHTCWVGETDGVPAIGDIHDGLRDGEGAETGLANALEFDRMVSSAVPVERLR